MNVRRLIAVSGMAVGLAGCTTIAGGRSPNDSFVHPNSKVRVIGPVSAQMTKVRFLGIGSQFDAEDVLKVHREALAKQAGANVILNVSADTKATVIFPMVVTRYIVSGEGAEVSSGGPVYYRGRDMGLAHRGMRIGESDWSTFLGHAAATLAKLRVPEAEQRDVVTFVQGLKKEIVE